MKLQSLLAIPFIIGLAACSAPPTIEASTREEAMSICAAENETAMQKVTQEKQLIKDKPYLFNRDREDFYDNFHWSFLHSSKWDDVSIIKTYCQPRKNSKHEDYWYATGFIEYLVVPTEESFDSESEVKKVITSNPTTWKER